ncbi:hypothetical protein LT679_05870 [Mucilaginibacter roseus]|uniref:Uncharacterized protein n=1 Tax=Mucilaginibacter roseus TaxID=1528868 RepID=A0ABS8U3M4_9SPHI|nr:hypothetical protein [Mucilaginibacter roseus]MCD8740123.1 hypothetical protein [Mucilaginibacter roseus]
MQVKEVVDNPKFTEVFTTARGAIYQSDSETCWYIDFAGKLARFDYRCLLKLKRAIDSIDIEQKLMDAKSPDMEIIFICACDDTYVLTLTQIIHFKELLQGTFVMLDLNQIINNRLYRTAV